MDYARVCSLCEDIKEMAVNKGNKLMIESWALDIIKEVKGESEEGKKVTVSIDLNDFVKVKLTPDAVKIYYNYMNEVNVKYDRGIIKNCMPEIDSEGYTVFQLWQFMNIFGEHMTAGSDPVIMPLVLTKFEGSFISQTKSQND